MKVLVTGGTVFVSKYVAAYFSHRENHVYVLNRNSRPQTDGVILIEGDRHQLGDKLQNYDFDAVIDVTAYTRQDVQDFMEHLPAVGKYILISSSAVYPETLQQPFQEEQRCGPNSIGGITAQTN